MRTRSLLSLLAAGLGLAVLAAAPAADKADKADKADAARVTKLITQLGSDDFDDREKASAELDAIGEPALDALRQASKSTDEEVRKRAETLTAGIRKRVESRDALAPKHVHLVFKGAPVKEAVEEFQKKSGYNITLHDPENKLKDRTVTLDTGAVTFWQAFDSFCAKAGLHEAEAADLIVPAPPPGGGPVPPAPAPLPGPGVGVAPGGPIVIGGPVVGMPQQAGAPEEIILADGKAESPPTDAASAVRVQTLAKTDQFGAAPDGEILIGLRLSLESKMQWQGIDKVTIRRAVDDQKQEWTQTTTDVAPAGPVFGPVPPGAGLIARPLPFPGPIPGVGNGLGGTRQDVAVHLKKGDKAARSLSELAGTVTATLLGETTPVITATDILKAGNKVFKGGENGEIKVGDVTRDANGQIIVRVELRPPADYLPVGNGPAGPVWRRPPRRPLPVPPAPALPAPGVAPAAVGVAIVFGPGIVGRGAGAGVNGLSLLDDKGNPINQVGFGIQTQVTNGVASTQYVLTYQADKGQEASKLVYSGRKVLNVEIPFTLKDVPLP